MRYERQRADFPLLLNEWNLLETGVEVGVCQGWFSANLLSFWPGRLHLVDAWARLKEYGEQYDHEKNYELTHQRLKEYEGRYEIHRKASLEAAGDFEDASQDFVYLDANHSYEAVRDDLHVWWPKVRKGGMLAGDDYGIVGRQKVNFGHGEVWFGVREAVDEWSKQVGRNISIDIFADWKNLIPGQGEIQARGWYCIK